MVLSSTVLTDDIPNPNPGGRQHIFTDTQTTPLAAPDGIYTGEFVTSAGDTLTTGQPTATDNGGTTLAVPATAAGLPATITDGPLDTTVCGSGATPDVQSTTVSAPGVFTATPLTITIDLAASLVPVSYTKLVGCHDGVVVSVLCTKSGTIPTGFDACILSRKKFKDAAGIQTDEIVLLSEENGVWSGGH
jgi:hypothetical protein